MLLLLPACARSPAVTEPPPAIEGFRAGAVVELDAGRVAAEAFDAAALGVLLADAGLQGGLQRTYTAHGPGIRRMVLGVLRFDSPAGAERYLTWLREHVDELIGEARPLAGGAVGPVFVHVPGGCCPKEMPVAIAAFRLGPEVVRVLLAGPAADDPSAIRLIEHVRAELRPST